MNIRTHVEVRGTLLCMHGFFLNVSRTAIVYGVVILGCAGAVAYWYISPEEKTETITVTRGDFIQEVAASGRVKPSQSVNLGFSQGGRIARVSVAVGDEVMKGDLLVNIENGDAWATLLQKEAILAAERAKLVELQEGTRPEEVAVAAAEVANKSAVFTQAKQSLIEAAQKAYVTAQDALLNRIDQFVINPRSQTPQLTFSLENSEILSDFSQARVEIESEFREWEPIESGVDVEELLNGVDYTRARLSELSNLLSIAAVALSRAVPTVAYPTATILEYASDVATGRTNVQNAIADVTAAETTYRGAETALATAESSLTLKEAGTIVTTVTEQEARVQAAVADVAAAEANFEKTEIRAPYDGTITAVDAKVGTIASANTNAVSMMGKGGFEIESYVPEINIALLAVDDSARVTLDAYGEGVIFDARVASIDPAETVRDGVSTYRVLLVFSSPDERIRSGMTANVVMITDSRTGIISVPQGLVFAKNGQRFVNVEVDGVRTERNVVTGAVSSFGNIEIIAGLREGDILPIAE